MRNEITWRHSPPSCRPCTSTPATWCAPPPPRPRTRPPPPPVPGCCRGSLARGSWWSSGDHYHSQAINKLSTDRVSSTSSLQNDKCLKITKNSVEKMNFHYWRLPYPLATCWWPLIYKRFLTLSIHILENFISNLPDSIRPQVCTPPPCSSLCPGQIDIQSILGGYVRV